MESVRDENAQGSESTRPVKAAGTQKARDKSRPFLFGVNEWLRERADERRAGHGEQSLRMAPPKLVNKLREDDAVTGVLRE